MLLMMKSSSLWVENPAWPTQAGFLLTDNVLTADPTPCAISWKPARRVTR